MNGALRTQADLNRTTSSPRLSQYSNGSTPSTSQAQAHVPSPGLSAAQLNPQGLSNQGGIRTLEEIEAEMRAAAQRSRTAAVATQRQQLLLEQQQQQQQYYQQQQRAATMLLNPGAGDGNCR